MAPPRGEGLQRGSTPIPRPNLRMPRAVTSHYLRHGCRARGGPGRRRSSWDGTNRRPTRFLLRFISLSCWRRPALWSPPNPADPALRRMAEDADPVETWSPLCLPLISSISSESLATETGEGHTIPRTKQWGAVARQGIRAQVMARRRW